MKKIFTIISLIFVMQEAIFPVQAGAIERGHHASWCPPRRACLSVVPDTGGMAKELENEMAVREPHDASWWQDPRRTNIAVSLPIFALRRKQNDPGIGKFTDIAPYFRDELATKGVNTILFLPHYQPVNQLRNTSPYAVVSMFAVNELYIDWSAVPEVMNDPHLLERLSAPDTKHEKVDYNFVLCGEEIVALKASENFFAITSVLDKERCKDYERFVSENITWLAPFAEFMTRDRAKQNGIERERWRKMYYYVQWIGYRQLKDALEGVIAEGGHPVFDYPMFRSRFGLEVDLSPKYFKDIGTRFPGIVNQYQTSVWNDLALWNWTECKENNYAEMLRPLEHWLKFGFEGVRHDALHFAYRFNNGQIMSGDEPGDDYVAAVAEIIRKYRAVPVAEAFENMHGAVERFGFITIKDGDWQVMSTHDDPRYFETEEAFKARFNDALVSNYSQRNARFVSFTLGDEWGDTERIKHEEKGKSMWTYRIPSSMNENERVRFDAAPFLRAWRAKLSGYHYDVWQDTSAIDTTFSAAADTFIKHKEQDGEEVVEIWAASRGWFFEEWGRDAFIALPGLLLSTGRFDEAQSVFRHFAQFERNGLIPNRIFSREKIEYNTVDGSLWFIQALRRYYDYTGDWAFVKEMAPVIRKIVTAYRDGTYYYRYGHNNYISMDKRDGLIMSPAQATWMDADPLGDEHPVTPRNGKAVEINALWYAALQFLALIDYDEGNLAEAEEMADIFDKVRVSFNERFWNAREKALLDVIDGDPHSGAIRANMLYAISQGVFKKITLASVSAEIRERLTMPLLPAERRTTVFTSATQDLLTPYGLRTLSPRDSHYKARYFTNDPPSVKDQAYHQGTAWPFLMGAYIDSLVQVRQDEGVPISVIRDEISTVLEPLIVYIMSNRYGSIDEVFDGGEQNAVYVISSADNKVTWDPAMLSHQNPGGTSSQAWSVGEVLRVLVEYGILDKPTSQPRSLSLSEPDTDPLPPLKSA